MYGRGRFPTRDPERLLHEAEKIKSKLPWRLQDFGAARTMGCLPRKTVVKK